MDIEIEQLVEQNKRLLAALSICDKNLDDIDTAGDMFRPPINSYFKYVARKCRENMDVWRRELPTTDVSERNQ